MPEIPKKVRCQRCNTTKIVLTYNLLHLYFSPRKKSDETKPASTAEQCHKFENLFTCSASFLRENPWNPYQIFFRSEWKNFSEKIFFLTRVLGKFFPNKLRYRWRFNLWTNQKSNTDTLACWVWFLKVYGTFYSLLLFLKQLDKFFPSW